MWALGFTQGQADIKEAQENEWLRTLSKLVIYSPLNNLFTVKEKTAMGKGKFEKRDPR